MENEEIMNLYSGLFNYTSDREYIRQGKINIKPYIGNINKMQKDILNLYTVSINTLGNDCLNKFKIYKKEFELNKVKNILLFLENDIKFLKEMDINKFDYAVNLVVQCLAKNINDKHLYIYLQWLNLFINDFCAKLLSLRSFEYILSNLYTKNLIIGIKSSNEEIKKDESSCVIMWKDKKYYKNINYDFKVFNADPKYYKAYRFHNEVINSYLNLNFILRSIKVGDYELNEKGYERALTYISLFIALMFNTNILLTDMITNLINNKDS